MAFSNETHERIPREDEDRRPLGKVWFRIRHEAHQAALGSAAGLIEKELRSFGLQIIAPRESATVFLAAGTVSGARLKEGEEKRFYQIGARIGETLAHVTKIQGYPLGQFATYLSRTGCGRGSSGG